MTSGDSKQNPGSIDGPSDRSPPLAPQVEPSSTKPSRFVPVLSGLGPAPPHISRIAVVPRPLAAAAAIRIPVDPYEPVTERHRRSADDHAKRGPRSLCARPGTSLRQRLERTQYPRDAHEHGVKYRDRLSGPVTTIWGFLSQDLSDDHSRRDAVARIIVYRAVVGLETCSPNTASYYIRIDFSPFRNGL
jgi:hypothetical protein